MLKLVIILKAVNEIALLALLGQGLLAVLAGPQRDRNPFYLILKTVASPATRLVRAVAPRVILDQHIGFLTFFLLLLVEFALILAKLNLLAQQG